jgi:hypothetical protein
MDGEPQDAGDGAPDAPGHDGGTDERLSRIETTLAEVISFLKGGGGPAADPEPEAPDIKAEVRKAVREVQQADRDRAAKAAEQESIKDQIGSIKAMLEKPPQEYRRATQAMGWNKP